MSAQIVSVIIGASSFAITLFLQVIRLTVKLTTTDNKVVAMDEKLKTLACEKKSENAAFAKMLNDHDKTLTILTTQMADIKGELAKMNDKLDLLLTPNRFSVSKRNAKK